MVEYREIPGRTGYRFGSDGSAWSRWLSGGRGGRGGLGAAWHRLNGRIGMNGYPIVCLKQQGTHKRRWYCLHRLVLEAFIGPCPDGCEACHNDGDRTNNAIANLRWDTRSSNSADAFRHGTRRKQLSDEQVIELRTRRAAGERIVDLRRTFGTSEINLSLICTGKNRKHVGGPITPSRRRPTQAAGA